MYKYIGKYLVHFSRIMKLTRFLKYLKVTPEISLVDESIQIRAKSLQPLSKGSNYSTIIFSQLLHYE